MTTETASPSAALKARADKLLDTNREKGTPLFKAFYIRDKIRFNVKPTKPFKRPKAQGENPDENPGLAPRKKPIYVGAVTVRRPNADDINTAGGEPTEFIVSVRENVWSLLNDEQKDAYLFDALHRIEVTEAKDGSLKFKVLKWSDVPWLDATVRKYGTIYENIVDPTEAPLSPPPSPEELAKQQTAERIAARPDAVVVTSDPED